MGIRERITLAALVISLLGGACRQSSPTAPGVSAPLAGRWTGTIADGVAGSGTAVLTMQQVGVAVSGTWAATFADAGSSKSGSLSGTMVGLSVSLFLTPGTPLTCARGGTLSGTHALTARLADDRLAGDYVVFTCDGTTTGGVEFGRN